jgi:hypothetical protein
MLSQTMSKQRPRDHQTTTCRLVNSNILETPKDKTITSATSLLTIMTSENSLQKQY